MYQSDCGPRAKWLWPPYHAVTYIFGRRDLIHYLHMYARHVGLSGKSADTPPPGHGAAKHYTSLPLESPVR